MHPSMFNNLPDPADILRGCCVAAAATFALGILVGWLIWG